MDYEDQRKINKNLIDIKRTIADDLDTIVDALIQQGVLKFTAKDEIFNAERKEDALIRKLFQSRGQSYKIFLSLLRNFGHADLVAKMEQTGTDNVGLPVVSGDAVLSVHRGMPEAASGAAGSVSGEVTNRQRTDVDANTQQMQMLSLILTKVSKLEKNQERVEAQVGEVKRGQEQFQVQVEEVQCGQGRIEVQVGEVKKDLKVFKSEVKYSLLPKGDAERDMQKMSDGIQLGNLKKLKLAQNVLRREKTVCSETFREFPNDLKTLEVIKTDHDNLLANYKHLQTTQKGLRCKIEDMRDRMFKMNRENVRMKNQEENMGIINQKFAEENEKLKAENRELEERLKEVESVKREKEEEFRSLLLQMQSTMEVMDQMNMHEKETVVWKRNMDKINAAFQRSMSNHSNESKVNLVKTLTIEAKPLLQRDASQSHKGKE